MAQGVILKPCGPLGGEGGLKILKNGPRYNSKLVHVGGEGGSKMSKNRSTWFKYDPFPRISENDTFESVIHHEHVKIKSVRVDAQCHQSVIIW